MLIIADTLAKIAGKRVNDNMVSTCLGLQKGGEDAGLNLRHRLAMFLAQLAHESGGWGYDREIWGPTPTQNRYEGRKDLGNVVKGDGSLFRGYTPMQITGRHNTTKFYNWCKERFEFVPNFIQQPHLMNSDPWEGIAPIWYWSYGKSKSLNESADIGDFIANTKLVNGRTNGLNDRFRFYGRTGLVLMGLDPNQLNYFQAKHNLYIDNRMGPNTLKVMHRELKKYSPVKFKD